MDAYDLIVIGTGTAAQVAASRIRKAGRSVAVIDHRPFGGTCALRGCDPKKMLVSGAEYWPQPPCHRGLIRASMATLGAPRRRRHTRSGWRRFAGTR